MTTKFLSSRLLLLSVCFFAAITTSAQVKIGGIPGAPHPSAVLELDGGTNKGLALPRLTNTQMTGISSPQDGLMIYNTDKMTPYIYRLAENRWMGVNSDSTEWQYDTSAKRLYLRRGLINRDSIYFDSTNRKFVFADKPFYTNSLGTSFPVTTFSGKYYFKSTASQYRDSLNSGAPYTMLSIMEVDSTTDPYFVGNSFRAFNAVAVTNPLANQQVGSLSAIVGNTIYAANNDTCFQVNGLSNSTSANGNGYAQTLSGIQNNVFTNSNQLKNVGSMYGIRNIVSFNAPVPVEVDGGVFGIQNSFAPSLTGKVNGIMYGILQNNVTGSKTRNYSIFTGLGNHRFGDSVIVSKTASIPRAIFDINDNSAMIMPVGNTAQRPVVPLVGMLRYNVETAAQEVYSGTQWLSTIRTTINADLPAIAANSNILFNFAVFNAPLGSAVVISPDAGLPPRVVIAWARVSVANNVEVRFENLSGTAIDPAAMNFYIRVIQ